MLGTIHIDNFGVVRYAWVADYGGASSFLNVFRADDSENTTRYSNPAFDEAMRNAAKATSLEERGKYYQQTGSLLGGDVPATPVYHYVYMYLVGPWVGGFVPDNRGNYYAKDMYIKEH